MRSRTSKSAMTSSFRLKRAVRSGVVSPSPPMFNRSGGAPACRSMRVTVRTPVPMAGADATQCSGACFALLRVLGSAPASSRRAAHLGHPIAAARISSVFWPFAVRHPPSHHKTHLQITQLDTTQLHST